VLWTRQYVYYEDLGPNPAATVYWWEKELCLTIMAASRLENGNRADHGLLSTEEGADISLM
jgi:hypothetical protein